MDIHTEVKEALLLTATTSCVVSSTDVFLFPGAFLTDMALPAQLRSIQHYLRTAQEHEKRDPVVAYYCKFVWWLALAVVAVSILALFT